MPVVGGVGEGVPEDDAIPIPAVQGARRGPVQEMLVPADGPATVAAVAAWQVNGVATQGDGAPLVADSGAAPASGEPAANVPMSAAAATLAFALMGLSYERAAEQEPRRKWEWPAPRL